MKLSFILASLLISGVSHAATVVCTGETFGYGFTITGKTDGAKLAKQVSVVVTQNRAPFRKGSMPVLNSTYNATTLNFTAKDAKSQLIVNTARAAGGGYAGTIDASGDGGGTQFATTCSVR